MRVVELALPIVPRAGRRAVRLGDRVGVRRRRIARRDHVGVAVEMSRAEEAGRLLGAHALGHVVARGAGASLLRRDDDDPVRGARAVDGRRRRRLENFDVLDVVRVDVGEAVDRLVLRRRRRTARARDRRKAAGERRVRHDHAVDDVERIARAENRRGAADLNLHAAARHAGVLEDGRAHDLAGEIALERLGRRDDELVGGDRRDRGRRVAAIDRGRLTGDRHALELQDVLLEIEVGGARGGRNQTSLSLESDCANENLNVARRNSNAVFTALVGSDTLLRTENSDGGFGDRCSDPGLRYFARDLARLRGREGRHDCETCHERCECCASH